MEAKSRSSLLEDLTCPITLEVFEDPISVPCCGKAFERTALVSHLNFRDRCPSCRGSLSHFDAPGAAKNVILAALVETLEHKIPEIPPAEQKDHSWKTTLTPVAFNSEVAELQLTLENSKFSVRPALFLAVLDRSGSMGGRPGEQVKTALKHIEALSKNNEHVKLGMLSYGSDCFEIKTADEYRIDGGTNFRAAFQAVDTYLSRFICSDAPEDHNKPNNVSTVTIVFMTDGCDGSGSRDTLIPEFREMLRNRWRDNPLSVHAVGFSRGCDRELLESIRTAGNTEGLFRYADHDDDADALCQKLTGIYDICSKASTVPLTYVLDGKEHNIRFSVNSMKHGSYKTWVKNVQQLELKIQTLVDDIVLPLQVLPPNEFVLQRWIGSVTDKLASDIIELNQQTLSKDLRDLACSLMLQNIAALVAKAESEDVVQRLTYLENQIEELQLGKEINVSRLSDLRFASLFGEQKSASSRPQIFSTQTYQPEIKKLDDKPYNEQHLHRYSRNNQGKERNDLQEQICSLEYNQDPEYLMEAIQNSTLEDIYHTDADGNNTLHLSSYCGHSKVVKQILSTFPNLDLEIKNAQDETAVTLAIKKRGFHFTLGHLLDAGATIPRPKSLERYAIENGYPITAQIVAAFGDGSTVVDVSMKPEYVRYMYQRVQNSEKKWDPNQYLEVSLHHRLKDLAKELLEKHGAQPTVNMLLDHCIPKKPDAPDTPEYLHLSELLLTHSPDLINQYTEPEQNAPLFTAAQKGSLPHVQYFLSQGARLEQTNYKGNTALWVASFMRYPCIIDELVSRGADINRPNLKGNPPLYGPCTRGSRKVTEQLVSLGADVEHVNSNGDTMILLCCRNGQWEVLDYLLDYVDEDFVNRKAHIDGFNAIMASAEQDKPECIRVLHQYGINLDQQTDPDNQILASATPLHIAAYYNRTRAARELLKLGANPNVQDKHGQTPMHLAVIQGNLEFIRLLKSQGADLTLQDRHGNIPMAYCRDRLDVRKALVDPVLNVLMHLSKGQFSKHDEKEACSMLKLYAGVPGILKPSRVVNVQDYDGSSPLLQATLRGNYALAQVLHEMGARADLPNNYSMTPHIWAVWVKNARLKNLFGELDLETCPPLARLEQFIQNSSDKILLFLGKCPDPYLLSSHSGITSRMKEFINTPTTQRTTQLERKQLESETVGSLAMSLRQWNQQTDILHLDQLIWDAKVFALNKIASGTNELSVPQLLAVALVTSNPSVFSHINTQILQNTLSDTARVFVDYLLEGLAQLPPYEGEVFVGAAEAQRRLYLKGQEFYWNHFASGSTLWKVALENTPQFTSKARKGVVFVVKSRTGRLVSPYSPFNFDAEVMWAPGTKFRVTNWYHGDVIALGQENIREHTFGIKEFDDERLNLQQMIDSEKNLIIELEEQ